MWDHACYAMLCCAVVRHLHCRALLRPSGHTGVAHLLAGSHGLRRHYPRHLQDCAGERVHFLSSHIYEYWRHCVKITAAHRLRGTLSESAPRGRVHKIDADLPPMLPAGGGSARSGGVPSRHLLRVHGLHAIHYLSHARQNLISQMNIQSRF